MTVVPTAGNSAIPPLLGGRRSSPAELDLAVHHVAARKDRWSRVTPGERAALLRRVLADLSAISSQWVEAECSFKGIPIEGRASGEEWLFGPGLVCRAARLLRDTLSHIEREGRPRLGRVGQRAGGQVTVRVFPTSAYDGLILPGYRTDVWLSRDVAPDDVYRHVARAYRTPSDRGSLCVVLGAGNSSSLQPLDVLDELFVQDRVVVLKCSPVQEHVAPILERAFAALIEPGYLRIVFGGADEATFLAQHPLVDALHMTGSRETYDALVYGAGEDGRARKTEDRPILTKPLLAELGSVTPVIVVPGPWSAADVAFHAENILGVTLFNSSLHCASHRLVLTHRRWSRRDELVARMRALLAAAPRCDPSYPGVRQRHARYLEAYPRAEQLGRATDASLPWLFAPGLDGADGQFALGIDPFCGALAEVTLDAESAAGFVDQAVDLLNDRTWGNLAVAILIHPASLRDADTADAFARAVARLRYGNVAVNTGAGIGFALMSPPWGAYPGNQRTDIQSGYGFVHNTYLLDAPEKSVTYAPFRPLATPPWFPSHRSSREVFRRLARFEAAPAPARLPGLLWHGLRA